VNSVCERDGGRPRGAPTSYSSRLCWISVGSSQVSTHWQEVSLGSPGKTFSELLLLTPLIGLYVCPTSWESSLGLI
jgi:hypothetical protein